MSSKQGGLLKIIEEQKQEIEKYKTKLRDVVIAHRGLTKEKELLEKSLSALESQITNKDGGTPASNQTEDAKQVNALVTALNTLTSAKAKMESSFQADKKQLREEKEATEKKCEELQQKVANLEIEIEDWKSKVIVERHERDKEQTDHGAIMKELQSLLAAERKQRQILEEEKKRRGGNVGPLNADVYKKTLERLQNELDLTRRNLELAEKKSKEPPHELFKLRDRLNSLQIEHQAAIEEERKRAELVEERAKRHALVQEERVMNLETKLADLSASVGTYDRLRQQDQTEIMKLKEYIVNSDLSTTSSDNRESHATSTINKELQNQADEKYNEAIKETKDIHSLCVEEIEYLKQKLEQLKIEKRQKKENGVDKNTIVDGLVQNLQDRIRSLTEETNVREKQHALEVEQWKLKLRSEKARFKETLAAAEGDFRGRLNLLETQLQKLRERSLAMLEDKEQEIHTLQGTFQAFLPESRHKASDTLPSLTSIRDGPRMLHYANELARRDVDIATLRRAKLKLETTLRDLQRAAATEAETYRQDKKNLDEEIARLNRSQMREGANMEYLKNVVLSFLLTNDPCSKRHMANAIAAVLKFSEEEQDRIAKQSHNSWFTGKT